MSKGRASMFLKYRNTCRIRQQRPAVRFQLEELEARNLLSVTSSAPLLALVEAEPNDTLDVAQHLGDLKSAGQIAVLGTVGNGVTGATDVDWFQFTLSRAATVTLGTHDPAGSSLVGVLGLYN